MNLQKKIVVTDQVLTRQNQMYENKIMAKKLSGYNVFFMTNIEVSKNVLDDLYLKMLSSINVWFSGHCSW